MNSMLIRWRSPAAARAARGSGAGSSRRARSSARRRSAASARRRAPSRSSRAAAGRRRAGADRRAAARCGSGMPTSASSASARAVACARAQAEVLAQRLGDLLADREHRVERAHRVLEHAGDLAAAQRAAAARGDAASRSRPWNVIAAAGARRCRAAGCRIDIAVTLLPEPDSPTRATRRVLGHVEAHAAARPRRADDAVLAADAERDAQVGDREQRCGERAHSSPRSFGSSASRSASVMQRERGDEDRHEERSPRRAATSGRGSARSAPRRASCPSDTWSTPTPRPRYDRITSDLDEADDEERQLHQDHVADVRQDVAEHARRGCRRRSPRPRARSRARACLMNSARTRR